MPANRGYDVVVDVDTEVSSALICHSTTLTNSAIQGDLGHTDLQEDLEFHNSSTSQKYTTMTIGTLTYYQTLTHPLVQTRSSQTLQPVPRIHSLQPHHPLIDRNAPSFSSPSTLSILMSIRQRYSDDAGPLCTRARLFSMS